MPGPLSNIPPSLEEKVLELSAKGRTAQQIAEQLRTEDNLPEVTHHSVYQVLARVRSTRGEQSAALTREKLSKFVLSDLETLDKRLKQVGLLLQDYDQAFAEERADRKAEKAKEKTQTLASSKKKKPKKKDPLVDIARAERGYSIASYQKLTREFTNLIRTRLYYSGAGKGLEKEPALDGLGGLLGLALAELENE